MARIEVDPVLLARWVDEGVPIREMARRLGIGYSTVRSRLVELELRTPRAVRLDQTRDALLAGAEEARGLCIVHGETTFIRRSGGFRCRACRSDAVTKRRRSVKATLLAEAGGCCVLCAYDRSVASLHFHHVDPSTKAFALADGGLARSLEAARAEVAKCVLLCANCHGEVEAGETRLPFLAADRLATGTDPG